MLVYVCMSISTHKQMCKDIYTHMCIHIHIYICAYSYMGMLTCTHRHTHTNTSLSTNKARHLSFCSLHPCLYKHNVLLLARGLLPCSSPGLAHLTACPDHRTGPSKDTKEKAVTMQDVLFSRTSDALVMKSRGH